MAVTGSRGLTKRVHEAKSSSLPNLGMECRNSYSASILFRHSKDDVLNKNKRKQNQTKTKIISLKVIAKIGFSEISPS